LVSVPLGPGGGAAESRWTRRGAAPRRVRRRRRAPCVLACGEPAARAAHSRRGETWRARAPPRASRPRRSSCEPWAPASRCHAPSTRTRTQQSGGSGRAGPAPAPGPGSGGDSGPADPGRARKLAALPAALAVRLRDKPLGYREHARLVLCTVGKEVKAAPSFSSFASTTRVRSWQQARFEDDAMVAANKWSKYN
jgi:hypothetical protein